MCLPVANAAKAKPFIAMIRSTMAPPTMEGPGADALRERLMYYAATHVQHRTSQTHTRRLKEFTDFARRMRALPDYTRRQALVDSEAIHLWLVLLADRKLGKTVVASAVTMLNYNRALVNPNLVNLHSHKEVQWILQSIRKNVVSRDKQSSPMQMAHLRAILAVWGCSTAWDEVMFAAVIGVAFAACLRPVEISLIRTDGFHWVLKDGAEVQLDLQRGLPPFHDIDGAIFELLGRKNRKGRISFMPLPTGRVLWTLYKHMQFMSANCEKAKFVFAARRHSKGKPRHTHWRKATWQPCPTSPTTSRVINSTIVPGAFLHCCGEPRALSRHFTGYAMRTGGTTHMQIVGIADPIRQAMGEWMSLGTARHYLQRLPRDQFGLLQPAMA